MAAVGGSRYQRWMKRSRRNDASEESGVNDQKMKASFSDGLAGNRAVSRSGGRISFADECDINDGNASEIFLFVYRYD